MPIWACVKGENQAGRRTRPPGEGSRPDGVAHCRCGVVQLRVHRGRPPRPGAEEGVDVLTDFVAVPDWFGTANADGGVAVGDLGGGTDDLVVFAIDAPAGPNAGRY